MRKSWNPINWFKSESNKQIDEEIKHFKNKSEESKEDKNSAGEGISELNIGSTEGYDNMSLGSFNIFHNRYIDTQTSSENEKIDKYRAMASVPEIADVIEDAVNESTQQDVEGEIVHLTVNDEKLQKNKNQVDTIHEEFNHLFYDMIDLDRDLWILFYTYLVDGRVFYERLINENKKKEGIKGIKILPTKTIDFIYDENSGNISYYIQYLSFNINPPQTYEEAANDPNIVVFYPSQIGHIEYSTIGESKKDITGYLDKAKIPYNQLKWLETAVIIYRIVRAPQRFVFKVDTGSMPLKKSMKFAEKVKEKMSRNVAYDPQTGELSGESGIMSMLQNFYLPQSADGRGSDVSTVGGDSSGFKELDDIYYFQKKLYQALKYPKSRIEAIHESQSSDISFNDRTGEIARDEIKWAKFLERHQDKICKELKELFLLHLDFKELKNQYGINNKTISIKMNEPNEYKTQMDQNYWSTKVENYMDLASNEEFSKYFLMKNCLMWDEEKIKENANGFKKDKELGFETEDSGF